MLHHIYEQIIIIPYRNRKAHLDIFINNAVPLFRKYLSPFKVVVVEQSDDGRLFNRGKILNVGFNEYKDKTKHIFTHDVDICPKDRCVSQLYNKIYSTDIMGIYTSYWDTLGGIIRLDVDTFEHINGYPNTYWGWGAEDKALQNRAETYGKTISKNMLSNDPNRYDYFTIYDDIKDNVHNDDFEFRQMFEYEFFQQLGHDSKVRCCRSSGLNNLEYTVIDRYDLDIDVDYIMVKI